MKSKDLIQAGLLVLLVSGFALAGSGQALASSCDAGWSGSGTHYGYGRHRSNRGHWDFRISPRHHRNHYRQVEYRTVVVEKESPQTVVVNVSNSNGSYTPVTLRREGGSFVGPRGEYYMTMPTEEQLGPVYGLKRS